jgi:hypothetical protein
MNTNLQLSFDFTKFPRRTGVAQADFEAANKKLLLFFRLLVYEAHLDLHRKIFSLFKPRDMDRNMPAVSMISFIRQGILKHFQSYCPKATKKRFKLITPNLECILIKKLNNKLRPSNIDTTNNKLIINQRTDEQADKLPIIFLGYTALPDFSRITGIYAVCIKGKEILWRTDINELGDQSLLYPILPKGTDPNLKDGIVKIKKTKKE